MSISTPWPNASCTIMPVVSGSQMQSYSPGGMGWLSRSATAVSQALAIASSDSRRLRSSEPHRPEKLSK